MLDGQADSRLHAKVHGTKVLPTNVPRTNARRDVRRRFVEGDSRVHASVLVAQDHLILLINRLIAGTALEDQAIAWAHSHLNDPVNSFSVWID